MLKTTLMASAAALVLVITQASAADMAVKARPYEAAPIPYANWTGVYLGLEGGYGWGRNGYDSVNTLGSVFQGNQTGILNNPFIAPPVSSVNNNGFLYGGFFGVQKQYGSWVFGIEGDIDGTNMKGSSASPSVLSHEVVTNVTAGNPTVTLSSDGVPVDTVVSYCPPVRTLLVAGCVLPPTPINTVLGTFLPGLSITSATAPFTLTGPLLPDGQTLLLRQLVNADVTRSINVDTKIDLLSSVRGKIGFTPWDSVMLYGTGGMALAHATNTITATQQTTLLFSDGSSQALAAQTLTGAAGGTMFGWAAGGGLDFKVSGTGLILGVEYLHYDFGKNAFTISDNGGVGHGFNNHQTVDAVKGRISYLLQ